jgi:allantoinase
MPLNSSPVTVDAKAVRAKREAAEKKSILDFGILGGLTPENILSAKELDQCGVIGFKAFMSHSGLDEYAYFEDDESLLKGMSEIAALNSVLFLHAENQTIINRLVAETFAKGNLTIQDFVASRPVISEIAAVQKAAAFAEICGCKIHIAHVSSGEVSACVTEAKKRGVDITVETCPHYLTLNVEDFERIGSLAKCCPPVREQEHVESLWQAIKTGEIDTIGSDHSPAPASMKVMDNQNNIFKIWGGMSSCQSTLQVMIEEGYHKRGVPLETIVRVCAANPAKRFGIYPQKGTIALGADADLTLIDLNASVTLQAEDLLYHHQHSPFVGKEFRGKVIQTILRGSTVYHHGQIVDCSQGQMVNKLVK